MSFRNKWQMKNDKIGVVSSCWPWSPLCSAASVQPFGTQERPLGTHAVPSSSLWELAFRQLPIKFQHTYVWLTSSCKGNLQGRILAWRIPGTEEPGGLPPMGSHRVGHDWRDLAASAASLYNHECKNDLRIKLFEYFNNRENWKQPYYPTL